MAGIRREVRIALENECRAYGATVVFATGSKHPIFEIRFRDQRRRNAISTSASVDAKSQTSHVVQDARRMLLSMGAAAPAITAVTPKSSTRPKDIAPPRPITIAKEDRGDPRTGGLTDGLRKALLAFARQRLQRWQGFRVPEAKRNEAALALIESWHPDVITDAAEMIIAARNEESDHDVSDQTGGAAAPAVTRRA